MPPAAHPSVPIAPRGAELLLGADRAAARTRLPAEALTRLSVTSAVRELGQTQKPQGIRLHGCWGSSRQPLRVLPTAPSWPSCGARVCAATLGIGAGWEMCRVDIVENEHDEHAHPPPQGLITIPTPSLEHASIVW